MSVEYIDSDIREPLVAKSSGALREVNVFKVSPHDLKQMFFYENTYRFEKAFMPDVKVSKSLHKLRELGGTDHFIKALHTSINFGIIGD